VNRDEALQIIDELNVSPNIRKHLLANEAIMRALARRFEPEREEAYAIVGLLHDADYEATEKDLEQHTLVIKRMLEERGAEPAIIEAILGHADKVPRTSTMAKALYACDNLAGLITAAALVRPDKKLAGLTVDSVLKRFKEPSFARGARRDEILTCESELGIPLREFVEIGLEAMKSISDDLGL
jgi:predicted hydrolase (HD superfamily)